MVFKREETSHFLSSKKNLVISAWKERSLGLLESYKGNFEEETEKIFNLLLYQLENPDNNIDDALMVIANKLAYEQAQKQEKLDVLIEVSAIGRSIIIDLLLDADISKEIIAEIIHYVNAYFDRLLQFSSTHFTELKIRQHEEHGHYISPNHKERLTLLGQMTSSFVHEFRNPLTSIMGFIQLLQAEQPEIKYLDIISKELDQLNYRITQFLNISKKETLKSDTEIFSISELVNDVIEFLYPSVLDVNASITCNIPDEAMISGSEEEFRQVLLNIILNALDVVADSPSPSIYISGFKLNGILSLNISNNGPRIPDDVLPTIFDPFITTKESGTGLGLFVCKEIILKHGGSITCHSTEFLTTFSIKLKTVND